MPTCSPLIYISGAKFILHFWCFYTRYCATSEWFYLIYNIKCFLNEDFITKQKKFWFFFNLLSLWFYLVAEKIMAELFLFRLLIMLLWNKPSHAHRHSLASKVTCGFLSLLIALPLGLLLVFPFINCLLLLF